MIKKSFFVPLLTLFCFGITISVADTNAVPDKVSSVEESPAELLKLLEKAFSGIRTVQTKFKQEKRLAIFKRAIVLRGQLALESPGRLAWRVNTPIKYVIIINGDDVRQWDEETNKIQRTNATGDPVFEVVLEQLELWFSGKFSSLSADYDIKVVSRSPVKLSFVPKKGCAAGTVIKSIAVEVRSDRKYIKEITIVDVSGDQTKLSFYDTILNEPVSEEEWKVSSGE